MHDDMIPNPRPTPAEVAVVANGTYDGTGWNRVSGETAAGK